MDKKRLIIYPLLLIITLAIATVGFTRIGLDGLLVPLGVQFIYFTGLFLVATHIKNNSIVDIHWGMGFVVGSWVTLLVTETPTVLSYMVVGLVTVWGLRLSIRLYNRNHGKPEDFRYAQWRKEWGEKVVIIAFFRVFMIQLIINFVVGSAGFAIIKYNKFTTEGPSQFIAYIGLLIALTGLLFEVIGDEQLRQHIQKKTGKLLQTGLWSVTRHPNYFGNILIWWGIYISGISLFFTGTISPIYYISLLLSPILMSLVFIKLSTPLLEKNMAKYEGWEAYTQRVPMLFPWGKKG